MAEVVSPTVARRRVRLAVREAREAAALTQQQVAEEMEWSLSKVIRIENGDVSISPNDLRPLLTYLGFKDRAQINALIADAKIARMRQHVSWWQNPEFRELPDASRRVFEYEAVAVAIRSFYIRYLPGILQLPEYAQALTGSFDGEISEQRVKTNLEARRLRREQLLPKLGVSLDYYLIFEEQVFLRTTGGPEVFLAQLRELRRVAEEGLVRIRMLPFSLDVTIANYGSFELLTLGEGGPENQVLYRESHLSDELIEDKAINDRHLDRFQRLWQVATDEADTINYMTGRIQELETIVAARQR